MFMYTCTCIYIIADSHRARLPPITMARVVMDEQLEERSRREYRFNAMEGRI